MALVRTIDRDNRIERIRHDTVCLHHRYNLAEAENDAVHLGDEYAGNGDEQRRAVHVNVAPDRQNESGDSRIDSELVRHQAKCDRKCGGPVQIRVKNDRTKSASNKKERSCLHAALPASTEEGSFWRSKIVFRKNLRELSRYSSLSSDNAMS